MIAAQKNSELVEALSETEWCHIRETVRMLDLTVAQIETTLRDGDKAVDTLGSAFTAMADGISRIEQLVTELSDEIESDERNNIMEKCDSLKENTQAAIVAFQFYDKVTQRLSHVSQSMEAVGRLISDKNRTHFPHEWENLKEKVRSSFTLEVDREMFDALMDGATVESAISRSRDTETKTLKNEIELF